MRLGIENMRVGEKANIICRSDYAYGAEGMRKSNGDVLVPPFATLCFEVSLLNVIDS
jgi:FKBP-type peptidyl-prolyl cis-trans isomerase